MGMIYNNLFEKTETLFKDSNYVNYWAYIGKGYFECAEKILVLGDSHYLPDSSKREKMEKYPWWTNEVIIADYLDQGYSQNFSSFFDFPKWIPQPKDSYLKGFRNTAKMLAHSGNQCSDYVWHSLAFFNFFQKPVASRPGSHEWLNADYDNYINVARNALDEVVKKLTPNVIIVWGKKDLYKKWMPSDKEIRYPNVYFFPINHPSYNIKSEFLLKWNDFVKQHHFTEEYAKHHPRYKIIESIFSKMCQQKDIVKLFGKWYGERSIGCELYQDWDCLNKCFSRNSLVTNKSNAIILLLTMTDSEESVLTICTRLESEIETQKIVNHASFDVFNQKRNTKCDGIFELCRMAPNVTDEEILSNIIKGLHALQDYRNSLNFND